MDPIKADLANMKGKTVFVPTMAGGWGDSRAGAPMADWRPHRTGADPPGALVTLRDGAARADTLHKAARDGDLAAVKALIAAGADPKARNKDGKTPFDYAKGSAALRGTDVYWRLNEARFK